jgi:acetyl-CoA/propionyl-CoA carboxylase biotin carboxyl carrier protein
MKMEHSVIAPHDGTVVLSTSLGDQVARDHVLAVVTADTPAEPLATSQTP